MGKDSCDDETGIYNIVVENEENGYTLCKSRCTESNKQYYD